ncbi:glycosyltransferase [Halosimplex aquaticum]|uniref:Glycosyltransferase n=1 Tax=Halosimplex aquaticum TaxID=3026162 RepID=A0ABD5Y886_9EURY|nr:glycosyltransferase [Halosimplex aquaticum]
MDLVVFAWDFYPNTSGGAHARWRFCKLAESKGHDVTVFTPRARGEPKKETVAGVQIFRPARFDSFVEVQNQDLLTPFSRILTTVKIFVSAFVWMVKNDPDGIHSDSHTLNWVAKSLAVIFGIPLTNFVGFTPSLKPNSDSTAESVLESLSFKFFMGQHVFCRNEAIATIAKTNSNSDVALIHGVVNKSKIKNAVEVPDQILPEATDDRISLVFVGRLADVKAPRSAVELVTGLPDEFHLTMIGDGHLRDEIEQMARSEQRVHVLGEREHLHTLKAISEADGLILTSKTESYPTVVFEALSLRTPVFSRPVGVLPNIEHQRLRLAELAELPQALQRAYLEGERTCTEEDPSGVCQRTLHQYSLENYTDTILSAYEVE